MKKVLILSLLTLATLPSLAKSTLDSNIVVNNNGIYILENGGKSLVKLSPNTLSELENRTLTVRGRALYGNDTRIIVVSKDGRDLVLNLHNGTDLSELGSSTVNLRTLDASAE